MGFIDFELIKKNNIKPGFLDGIGSYINSKVAIDYIFTNFGRKRAGNGKYSKILT